MDKSRLKRNVVSVVTVLVLLSLILISTGSDRLDGRGAGSADFDITFEDAEDKPPEAKFFNCFPLTILDDDKDEQ